MICEHLTCFQTETLGACLTVYHAGFERYERINGLSWELCAVHFSSDITVLHVGPTGADPEISERGGGKGAKLRTERRRRKRRRGSGAFPRKFWKIRCDLLRSGIYFWDQSGLGYHSKLGLCWTKNSSDHDFDSHTHAYNLTLPKTPRISATIKSKLYFKGIFFRHCIQCKKN